MIKWEYLKKLLVVAWYKNRDRESQLLLGKILRQIGQPPF